MKKRWIGLMIFMIMILLILAVGVLYIQPSRSLDMRYSDIVWTDKLKEMIDTRKPEIILTDTDLNNLAKKGLADALIEQRIPVTITGAEFHLQRNILTVNINADWGLLAAGGSAEYSMVYEEGQLYISPISLSIKQLSLPPEKLGLEPIVINLGDYLPDIIKISRMDFEDDYLRIRLSADWLELIKYLQEI